MAAAEMQEALSKTSGCAYHVFLSFRGEDTRRNFTARLYTALVHAGIHTFRDDEIERGENIGLKIHTAIQKSEMSIIVFSKNYASSRWCLDELVMIMEQKKLVHQFVLPVFYDVDPSQVRNQTGGFAEAFARHEKNFKEKMDRVNRWREALQEAADLAGLVFENGKETQFIQNIVEEIEKKKKCTMLYVASHLVGIDSQIADINSWLQDGSNDVGIAIIYGIGGIGKTTIAKTVYNLNFHKFEGRSFLANVRETLQLPNGLVQLQMQLLSDMHKGKANKINNVNEGIIKIKDAVCCRRVLLVIDDVNHLNNFNAIVGMQQWFYPGSKIVITSRYARLLRTQEVSKMFKVEELNNEDSLQLFCWHAFGQNHPIEDFVEHSKSIVHLCGGIPLALKVLGSFLLNRSVHEWKSALLRLDVIPNYEIHNLLKISYDCLGDDYDKNLFLDIACFFNGMDKDYVVSILDGCGFHAEVRIQNLVDCCLITINGDNKIVMHRLVRDMGREIVRQESLVHPGKRSRIWHHEDAFNVLRENTGTDAIWGFSVNQPMLVEDRHARTIPMVNCAKRDSTDNSMLDHGHYPKRLRLGLLSWQPVIRTPAKLFPMSDEPELEAKAFAKMHKLKLLQLNYVKFNGGYEAFPKGLVWLCWHGFPLKSIPDNLHLEKLVVLDMRNSSLINVWKGKKFLMELKILNLSHSHGLVRTPDFSGLPCLERLKLKNCINLIEVDESIGNLQRLVLLNLKDCKNLKKLPGKIGLLESLKELILSGCSKLNQLPEDLQKMKSLKVLHADGMAVSKFQHARDMEKLNLLSTKCLRSIFWPWVSPANGPDSTSFSLALLPFYLLNLSLVDCNLRNNAIPNDLCCLPFLAYLDLSRNPIRSLPESITNLTKLEYLLLEQCTWLQSLPELPKSLKELKVQKCTSLERIINLPNFFSTLCMEIYDCGKLAEVQGIFKLEPIRNFDLIGLKNLGLINLESLGSIVVNMGNLWSCTERKTPLQVLHECGIFSVFLPGREVPDWFSYQNEGSLLSVDMHHRVGYKICGLSLCIVYAGGAPKFNTSFYTKINNKTKGLRWTYCPTCYGIPEANKSMMWLSYWKFGDQLAAGDHVDILVAMSPGFQVQKSGARIVYEQKGSQSNNEEMVQGTSLPYRNLTVGDMSAYQVQTSAYFLCNHRNFIHQDIAKNGWDSRYDYLFSYSW